MKWQSSSRIKNDLSEAVGLPADTFAEEVVLPFHKFVEMDYISHLCKDKKLAKIINATEAPHQLKFHKNICLRLCSSIMSQQLSTKVAKVMYHRFLLLFGDAEPTPQQIVAMPFEKIRAIGLSNAKAQYVLNVAQFAIENKLDDKRLKKWATKKLLNCLRK